MSRYRVAVTDDRFGSYREEEAELAGVGARLEVWNLKTEKEAEEALEHADGILVNLFPLTARVISALAKCRVICRYGVGVDNVDVEAATRKGIWVARVPDYCVEEVSDHALALLLGCARRLAYKDRKIREGLWNLHGNLPCHRMAGGTLGIVGFGRIGRRLCGKVAGLGLARVLVCDPYVDASIVEGAGGVRVDLDTLARESDYISLHVPLTEETRGMIGERELAMMKRTAILVNTARGQVLDERAAAAALKEGRVAGAGLDVFESEPLPAASPLRECDTVIVSDHAAWYSEESIVELKVKAGRNIAAVLAGGRPRDPVNSV